jgi:hypothetical protein
MVMSLIGLSFSIYAQETAVNEKEGSSSDMSYFSQEEMKFILGDKEKPWNYGRLSISPYYIFGIGEFSAVLPYTTGFVLMFDHGIHHAFKPIYKKKSPFLPGIRFELAFNIYADEPVYSLSLSGGPVWLFPIAGGQGGEIILSSTFGMNFMRGQIGTFYFNNDAMYLTASLGYGISFSRIFLTIESKFTYIFDEKFPWMGVGGSLGVGYKFPSAAEMGGEGN